MLLTLALVVLFASIAVFFAQEFIRAIKKVFAIKGVPLFLPLFAASWLIYTFDYWALWIVYYYREMLQIGLSSLIYLIPLDHAIAEPIALIILLTAISVLPVFIIDYMVRRKTFLRYKYPNVTSAIILIVSAVLLLAL